MAIILFNAAIKPGLHNSNGMECHVCFLLSLFDVSAYQR